MPDDARARRRLPRAAPTAATTALAAALAATALAPAPARAEEGGFPPTLRLGAGGDAFTLTPKGLLQLDLGRTFAQSRPGGPSGGFNPRRARLGVEGEFGPGGDFGYSLTWDFGGSPGGRNRLYDAYATWSGLDPFEFRAGVYEASYSLQTEARAVDLLFLERAAPIRAASGIAAGSSRVGAGFEANGERWFAALNLTGGKVGPGSDSAQRGAVARVAGRPVATDALTLHLGLSGSLTWRPARSEEGPSVGLSDAGELELDRDGGPLGTGDLRAERARTGVLEVGLNAGRLQTQVELVRIEVDRGGADSGETLAFSGGYAQVSYTLLGSPRRYDPSDASWLRPVPEEWGLDPSAGKWGALEVGARYSRLDLNDRDVRGGRQEVVTAGLGWWPYQNIGLFAQWQGVRVSRTEDGEEDRRYQAVSLRTALRF